MFISCNAVWLWPTIVIGRALWDADKKGVETALVAKDELSVWHACTKEASACDLKFATELEMVILVALVKRRRIY